jgi:hypothetical protein
MKTEIRAVLPDEAKALISSRNPRIVGGKTNVNQWHVEEFCRALRQGNFKTTHQGIAIDENGNLVDGFHRLTAIAQTGIAAVMPVTTGVPECVVPLIDRGQRRTNGSVLGLDKRVAEIISRIATLALGGGRPDENTLIRVSSVFRESAQSVIDACPSTRSFFSCAPVKCAAALASKSGHGYALNRYRFLVLMKAESDPMVPVLMRALTDEHDPNGRLARAWIGFTRPAPLEKIILRNKAEIIADIRSVALGFMS